MDEVDIMIIGPLLFYYIKDEYVECLRKYLETEENMVYSRLVESEVKYGKEVFLIMEKLRSTDKEYKTHAIFPILKRHFGSSSYFTKKFTFRDWEYILDRFYLRRKKIQSIDEWKIVLINPELRLTDKKKIQESVNDCGIPLFVFDMQQLKPVVLVKGVISVQELWIEIKKQNIDLVLKTDECEVLDFKQQQIKSSKLAEIIVAMANTYGGILVFGVDNSKKPVGLNYSEYDLLVNSITNICSDVLEPIHPQYEKITLDEATDRRLLCVSIPKFRNHHHCTKSGRYLKRVGSSNKPITPGNVK